jgi:hypothetical protein
MENLYNQALSGDPQALNNFFLKVEAKATELEIPASAQRILPKQMSSYIANQILSQPTPEARSNAFTDWQMKMGDRWFKAAEDMVKDKALSPEYLVATYATSPVAKKAIFDNVANKQAINKAYDASSEKLSGGSITSAVATHDPDVLPALLGRGADATRAKFASAFMSQIQLEAKKRIAGGTAPDQAVEEAYELIIDGNFNKINSGKDSILVPKMYEPTKVENFMQQTHKSGFSGFSSDDDYSGFKKLEVAVEPSFKDQSKYYKKLKASSFWETDASYTGLTLMAVDESGSKKYVPNKNGQPIKVLFKDM